jgi:hypothetical protein
MGQKRNARRVLMGNSGRKNTFGIPKFRSKYDIKIGLKEM